MCISGYVFESNFDRSSVEVCVRSVERGKRIDGDDGDWYCSLDA